MLLTERVVLLHLPKTGGTWLRTVLEQHAPASWRPRIVARHVAAAELSPQDAAKPRIVFVRDPWDWHVSLATFYRDHYVNQTGAYSAPMRDWNPRQIEWAERTMRAKADITAMIRESVETDSLETVWLERLVPTGTPCAFGRFERLREDVVELLGRYHELPDRLVDALRSDPPTNTSSHAHFSSYYDRKLAARVGHVERSLVERFNYQAPATPVEQPQEGSGP